MEIIIVDAADSERRSRFERVAQSHGWTIRLTPPGGSLGDFSALPVAVVAFVDGDVQPAVKALAWAAQQMRYLGSPVIAVANDDGVDQEAMRAAGAALVCGPSATDEQILEAIQNHRDAQPVAMRPRAELLDPVSEAAVIALREMAGVDVIVRCLYRRAAPLNCSDLTAVIRLKFVSDGFLALCVPPRTAELLTQRILGENCQPGIGVGDYIFKDCMGELCNVIAGQSKALLARSRYHFTFSGAPSVSLGSGSLPATPGMDCFVIVLGSECGDFAIQVGLGSEISGN